MEGAVCSPTHGKSFIDAKLSSGDRLSLRKRSEIEAELLPVRPRLQQILLLLHCGKRQRPERIKNNYHRGAYVWRHLRWRRHVGRLIGRKRRGNKKNGTFVLVEHGRSNWHPRPGLCSGVIRGVVELLQLSAPPLITVQHCIFRGVPNSIFIHFISSFFCLSVGPVIPHRCVATTTSHDLRDLDCRLCRSTIIKIYIEKSTEKRKTLY